MGKKLAKKTRIYDLAMWVAHTSILVYAPARFQGNNQINSRGYTYGLQGNMTADGVHTYA